MLHPHTMQLFIFVCNTAYSLKTIPFQYIEEKKRFRRSRRCGICLWRLTQLLMWSNQLFLCIRFQQAFANADLNQSSQLTIIILQLIYTFAYSVPCLIEFILVFKENELLETANFVIVHYRRIFEKYSLKNCKSKSQTACENIMNLFIVTTAVHPAMTTLWYFHNPYLSNAFLTSLLPVTPQSVLGWTLGILFAVPLYYLMVISWTIDAFMISLGVISIYNFVFVLQEINPNTKSISTRKEVRTPENALFIYKTLQILNISMNSFIQDTLVLVNTLCLTFSVVCISALIRYHDHVPITAAPAAVMITSFCTVYIIVVNIKLSQCYEFAKAFRNSWNQNRNIIHSDRKLMLKHIRAFRPLRFSIASFGFYQKPQVTKVIGRIVYYTAKFLIFMRNLI